MNILSGDIHGNISLPHGFQRANIALLHCLERVHGGLEGRQRVGEVLLAFDLGYNYMKIQGMSILCFL